ncbi:Hypothetical protein P9303_10511 [Prochlorococcus marinus str. MIT 9303]|uniref:Uncharacterized protein n=1 Tax=Prochlorococcus marinus (strain MIT 9303) TaxID=59922 RepID=A2C8J0_PROM3|nr:Hypothetical protein P9303_10511 [Prochlorococcus marinus str. MIT 9303]
MDDLDVDLPRHLIGLLHSAVVQDCPAGIKQEGEQLSLPILILTFQQFNSIALTATD